MESSAFVEDDCHPSEPASVVREVPPFFNLAPTIFVIGISWRLGGRRQCILLISFILKISLSQAYVRSSKFFFYHFSWGLTCLCLLSYHLSWTCLVTSIALAMLLLWELYLFWALIQLYFRLSSVMLKRSCNLVVSLFFFFF